MTDLQPERRRLFGLAYRMIGKHAVQDTLPEWNSN